MTIAPVKLDTLILDSAAQPRIDIDWVLASEYAEAMRDGAKFPPIIVFCNGKNWLADGFHRVSAAKQAGLSELAADIRQGTRRDAILYSVGANAENGKRRTNGDKHRAVKTLLQDEEWQTWSNEKIAKTCRVNPHMVAEIKLTLNIQSDERTYTTKHGTVATMHTANIGNRIDISALWNAEQERKRPVSYHVSDDSYEWFTPQEYIEAARAVMGSIDLDPASCKEANKTIKAKRFYTKQDSGLDHEWVGCVWLNPPYNMPLIEDFSNKAIESYKSGAIKQAVILTNNSTDTGWFHALAQYPFCLTRGRVRFTQPSGGELATRQGQAIFYLGKNIKKFVIEFSKFGIVVARYEHCRP